MIIEISPQHDHYVVSTDSLERPGNTVGMSVKKDEPIGEIVSRLSAMRGRPK